ncbi:MAG: FeoB-associated Cys-rich membrane protein [Erysipelotrichaceae bacterium]|nr:FeoB-associated Cys-rich membrane protein [Erysipelotrichaceae bacterium]MCI9312470.1 FeoB-associated Cys-rich membrane protein [Erysipelotrichaceae bacterium]
MATLSILVWLVMVVLLALRSLWKSRNKCGGQCGNCSGCHKRSYEYIKHDKSNSNVQSIDSSNFS